MKKYIALAIACAALAAGVSYLPAAVEASVPAAVSISPTEVYYSESVNTSGTLCYIGQGDVTSALPLVLSEFAVEEGDHVEVGDVIARVDRKASETFISSLGKVSQLAAATASLSTAMSLIPEEITADRSGTVISTAGAGAAVESRNQHRHHSGYGLPRADLCRQRAEHRKDTARSASGIHPLSLPRRRIHRNCVEDSRLCTKPVQRRSSRNRGRRARYPRTPPTRACAQGLPPMCGSSSQTRGKYACFPITPLVRTRRVSMSTCLKMEPLSSTRFSPARNFQTVQRS